MKILNQNTTLITEFYSVEEKKLLNISNAKISNSYFYLNLKFLLNDHVNSIIVARDLTSKQIVGYLTFRRYFFKEDTKPISHLHENYLALDFNYELDTYTYIDYIHVYNPLQKTGIGTLLYLSLESLLTLNDCIYESRRTIDGQRANLLAKIRKIPVFRYHQYADMLLTI